MLILLLALKVALSSDMSFSRFYICICTSYFHIYTAGILILNNLYIVGFLILITHHLHYSGIHFMCFIKWCAITVVFTKETKVFFQGILMVVITRLILYHISVGCTCSPLDNFVRILKGFEMSIFVSTRRLYTPMPFIAKCLRFSYYYVVLHFELVLLWHFILCPAF